MISGTHGHRWGLTAPAVAALFLLAGCGYTAEPVAKPVLPGTSVTAPSAVPSPPAAGDPSPEPLPAVLPASTPVTLDIPAIDTRSELLSLGLRENQTLDVPPGEPGSPASWYNLSPTPGERGPAVMLGHVNATDGGEGVFAGLRELKAGDLINVIREDGSTAVFEFQHGEQYLKNDFPTQTVYGNTDGSELRLITCDGYNPETGAYDDNYVVYATLVI
ncbi:sortase [Arthrobacter echini]|uniref:Sortase n=1 Tax=Arthrobacter echini TaxID=1529066 RepID=A0A4V3Z5U1_9MICC|nr:sortase [Arthrobacter echini]THJ67929.1 sortase [Arthrobacter echini]